MLAVKNWLFLILYKEIAMITLKFGINSDLFYFARYSNDKLNEYNQNLLYEINSKNFEQNIIYLINEKDLIYINDTTNIELLSDDIYVILRD